jgi:hypothetical protein
VGCRLNLQYQTALDILGLEHGHGGERHILRNGSLRQASLDLGSLRVTDILFPPWLTLQSHYHHTTTGAPVSPLFWKARSNDTSQNGLLHWKNWPHLLANGRRESSEVVGQRGPTFYNVRPLLVAH